MLCHHNYDLMAFTTPGESPLRYPQGKPNAGYGHEEVAVILESTLHFGHAVNLHAISCRDNSERKGERRGMRKAASP